MTKKGTRQIIKNNHYAYILVILIHYYNAIYYTLGAALILDFRFQNLKFYNFCGRAR